MALTRATFGRFVGAVLLGAAATAVDQPRGAPQPLRASRPLVPTPGRSRLDLRLTPGKQAMGVRITRPTLAERLAQPNARADLVLVTRLDPERQVARVIAENVRILAVTDGVPSVRSSRGEDLVATLEVTPDLAARIAEAQRDGELHLRLRRTDDERYMTSAAVTGTGARVFPGAEDEDGGRPVDVADVRPSGRR